MAIGLLGTAPARAEAADREACIQAYVDAQSARTTGALVRARRKLETCADSACPGMVQRDCTQWLDDVSRALPSVVLAARDADGHDLLDATATVDGAAVPLDGRVLPLDPGRHTIAFRAKTGELREQTVLLAEGEHDRRVVAVFPAPPAPIPPVLSRPVAAPAGDTRSAPAARRVPVASWVLGGLGVASLGAFGYLAARGASDRASLACDRGCSSGDYGQVDREFWAANVALGAGIVLVGAAIVTWLVAGEPANAAPSAARGGRPLGGSF